MQYGRTVRAGISTLAILVVWFGADVRAQSEFQRGDTDANGSFNLTDNVVTLSFLFQGSAEPSCLDAADANDDGQLNLTDAVFGLGFLFQGGAMPPAPFEACGLDGTEDGLGCASFPPCGPVAPTVSFTSTPEGGVAPVEIRFEASISSGDDPVTSIEWDFGDDSTGSGASVTHTFASAGTFDVVVTVTTQSGATATETRPITISGGGGGMGPGGVITVDHEALSSCSFGVAIPGEAFDIGGIFLEVDPSEIPNTSEFGCDVTEEVVAGCRVRTRLCAFSGDIGEPPDLGEILEGVEGTDPGTPGRAETAGGGAVELVTNPSPEIPLSEFIYSPTDGADLLAAGFDCGGPVTVSFPGGTGLGAFSVTVEVPPCFSGVSPVASAGSCTIIPTAGPMVVTWDDAPGYSGVVEVTVSREVISIGGPETAIEEVSVACEFSDDAGTGEIPAAALALLPSPDGAFGSTTVELRRVNAAQVEVATAAGGGTRTVTALGSEIHLSVEQLVGLPPFPGPGPVPLPEPPDAR